MPETPAPELHAVPELNATTRSAGGERPTRVRVFVTCWLAFVAICAYLCRNSLGVAESQIRAELGLTEEQMGWILGPLFFWVYALGQIPTAALGQRWGSRVSLPLFSAASSLATAVLGAATGMMLLIQSRAWTGLAQAGLFPASARSISEWHPQAERARASGVLGAAMSVGGAVGVGLTGWMLGFMSWKGIFVCFAVPGLVWSVGFAWWFRNEPDQHPSVNDAEARLIAAGQIKSEMSSSPTNRRVWLQLASSPAAWSICGQQFCRAGAAAFFASWFATYLKETRGVSTEFSGVLTALPLLATVLGSLMGGWISDRVLEYTGSLGWARKGVAAMSLIVCGFIVSAAYFVEQPTTAVLMISTGAMFAGFAGPCAYSMSMDMGGRNVSALFSTMNMIGNFGAGALPLLAPQFREFVAERPALTEGFGGNSWNAVLLLFAATYFVAAAFWLLLRAEGTVYEQAWLGRDESAS